MRLKAGLETRGYFSQYPGISVDRLGQKFKHVSTSLSALFYFRKDSLIRPYLLAGVHSGHLYQSEVVEELITLDGTYYTPANINHSDYAHFNLSGTGGFGIDFHGKLWLECSYNRDLIAPLQNSELKAFNSMYSFNVGINLLNWFKK